MKSALYLIIGCLALGIPALWVWRLANEHAEPLPRLVQDMTARPARRYAQPPAGAVPFEQAAPLPPSERSGEALFLLHCAACHGADATGRSYVAQQPGMPDVSDLTTTEADAEELSRILADGRGAMPAFAPQLSEGKRKLILQYITTLHKP